jgi:hypothetical protein
VVARSLSGRPRAAKSSSFARCSRLRQTDRPPRERAEGRVEALACARGGGGPGRAPGGLQGLAERARREPSPRVSPTALTVASNDEIAVLSRERAPWHVPALFFATLRWWPPTGRAHHAADMKVSRDFHAGYTPTEMSRWVRGGSGHRPAAGVSPVGPGAGRAPGATKGLRRTFGALGSGRSKGIKKAPFPGPP